MSYTIESAVATHASLSKKASLFQATKLEDVQDRAYMVGLTAKQLLEDCSPEEIREYLSITRDILNDLEQRMNEIESIEQRISKMEEAVNEHLDVATKQEEPTPTPEAEPAPKAARVKRSKTVDKQVEAIKGKRDINAGDKKRIDDAKAEAAKYAPKKVEQEKRSTKKAIAEKAQKQPARKHEGMTYAEVRKQVSERKNKLNKADQARMTAAGCKNNTWDGAITCLEWLDRYFPITK